MNKYYFNNYHKMTVQTTFIFQYSFLLEAI